jgi:hypothetical protein
MYKYSITYNDQLISHGDRMTLKDALDTASKIAYERLPYGDIVSMTVEEPTGLVWSRTVPNYKNERDRAGWHVTKIDWQQAITGG